MKFEFKVDDRSHNLAIKKLKPVLTVSLDGEAHSLEEVGKKGLLRSIQVDGRLVSYSSAKVGNKVYLHLHGRTWGVEFIDPRDSAREDVEGGDDIRAPMPGVVVGVSKKPGEAVKLGEIILTIESMKMETNLVAPRDGTVGEIAKAVGETFEKDQVLASLEEVENA